MVRFWVLSLLVACFSGGETGSDGEPAVDTSPLHPLAAAPSEAWRQRVLFVARPGEKIQGMTTAAGRKKKTSLVVTLVDVAGGRRSVTIGADGSVEPLQHVVSESSRGSLSEIGPDGRTRAQIEVAGPVTMLRLHDTLDGEPRALVRDAGRMLRHPSFTLDGSAVYVDEGGELGGIWMVRVADGAVTRVVPDKEAATPIAFRFGDEEGVAWIEELPDDASRVVLSMPGGPPAVDTAAFLAQVPQDLWPSVSDASGATLKVRGCDDKPRVVIEPAPVGVRVPSLADVLLSVITGDRGAFVLAAPTPGGAAREVLRVKADRDGWWLDAGPAQAMLPSARYVGGASAAAMPTISSCLPAMSSDLWLQIPLWVGDAKARLTTVSANAREVVAYGNRGGSNQPFVVYAGWDGRPTRVQASAKVMAVDAMTAVEPQLGLEASIDAGGVVWRKGKQGMLLGAESGRTPIALALAPQATALFIADGDDTPGVDRVDLSAGGAVRVANAPATTLAAFEVDGVSMAAWTETWDGRPAVVVARQPSSSERSALQLGPAGAVGFVPAWVPGQVEDGKLVRCTGELDVKLTRDGDALTLQVGSRRESVYGLIEDLDGGVRLVGRGPGGDPRVLLEVLPERGLPPAGTSVAVKMIDRVGGFSRAPESIGWYPADAAAQLPQGGSCKMFQ